MAVNGVLASLGLEKHPDKTFGRSRLRASRDIRPSLDIIGRTEKGFDFLGYHFSREGLTVAKATTDMFVERAARLYEQDRKELLSPSRLGAYIRRWASWAQAATTDL